MGVGPHGGIENSRDLDDDCSADSPGELQQQEHNINIHGSGGSNVDENELTQKGLLLPENSNINFPSSCPAKKHSKPQKLLSVQTPFYAAQ